MPIHQVWGIFLAYFGQFPTSRPNICPAQHDNLVKTCPFQLHRIGQKGHGQLPEHLEVAAWPSWCPFTSSGGYSWHILSNFPKVAVICAPPNGTIWSTLVHSNCREQDKRGMDNCLTTWKCPPWPSWCQYTSYRGYCGHILGNFPKVAAICVPPTAQFGPNLSIPNA